MVCHPYPIFHHFHNAPCLYCPPSCNHTCIQSRSMFHWPEIWYICREKQSHVEGLSVWSMCVLDKTKKTKHVINKKNVQFIYSSNFEHKPHPDNCPANEKQSLLFSWLYFKSKQNYIIFLLLYNIKVTQTIMSVKFNPVDTRQVRMR